MSHPLVTYLRFTRAEWVRGFEGVSADDAIRHVGRMNSLSWMIGHLAWHEQRNWLQRAQGRTLAPEVERCGYGQPASTPPLDETWAAWRAIADASDPFLDALTVDSLQRHFEINGRPHPESIGTCLLRVTFHYWFHLGEAQAVRKLQGHTGLPEYVGEISRAPYRPEAG